MSHVATVQTVYNNEEAIRKSLADLGCEVHDHADVRSYGSVRTPADIVGRMAGSTYDIGFKRQGETFAFVGDQEIMYEQDNGRNNIARRVWGQFKQAYPANVLEQLAHRTGRNFHRRDTVREDGAILVVLD